MEESMKTPLIELKDIYKIYTMGDEEVRANDGINLKIYSKSLYLTIVCSRSGPTDTILIGISK